MSADEGQDQERGADTPRDDGLWGLAREAFALPFNLLQSSLDILSCSFSPQKGREDDRTGTDSSAPAPPASTPPPAPLPSPAIDPAPLLGSLDPSRIVVLGDGLAAGVGEFALHEFSQAWSFPAQLAARMGVHLTQPLFQAPGVECPLLSPDGGIRPADQYQTTVLRSYPPSAPPANLSVPGAGVVDAATRKGTIPVVGSDKLQNAYNLIVGAPPNINSSGLSMLETAVAANPTLAIIALGFTDLMGGSDIDDQWTRSLEEIVSALAGTGATVVVCSPPSPLQCAAYSTPEQAAEVLKVSPRELSATYGLADGDRLSVSGLIEIGTQLTASRFQGLEERHLLRRNQADKIHAATERARRAFAPLGGRSGVLLVDLSQLFDRLATEGIPVANRLATSGYLGGVFSLNGIYPGATGQALIANEILAALNHHCQARLKPVALDEVAAHDEVARYAPAGGSSWTLPASVPAPPSPADPPSSVPGHYEPAIDEVLKKPLTLPPGNEQVIPLNPDVSFHGDGMRVVDVRNPADARFGGTGDLRFDGLAMFGSHLRGSLRFRFSPQRRGLTHFTVELIDGRLAGDDGVLASPGFYRFPLLDAMVIQPPGMLAEGDLDVHTGRVDPSTLVFYCIFANSGLAQLGKLNPHFPNPAIIAFSNEEGNPRVYGSAWATFRQRDDGLLDFSFHGTAFVPLGPGTVFPLPFPSADGRFPLLAASGTALHPHLHLSTYPSTPEQRVSPPAIPTNTTREFQLCTARSSFGDLFHLDHPALGVALGRSHLAGRLRIQFGERFGNSIPFSATFLPPAGLLDDPPYAPIQKIFPSKLPRGLLGHDGIVHYPLTTYSLSDTFLLEDPLDIALGAINASSGEVVGNFLHRGLIGQDLIFALFRVEPRTPKASFQFRGKARFVRGHDDSLRFQLNAAVYIPYPPGFMFPRPNLADGFPIGFNSSLDPYLQLEAVTLQDSPGESLSGGQNRIISATNVLFSYHYVLPTDQRDLSKAVFKFVNHSDGDAVFEMTSFASLAFYNADAQTSARSRKVASFTALGIWSKDPGTQHTATMEISRDPDYEYVSIQIDGGRVVSTDTRPKVVAPPLEPIH